MAPYHLGLPARSNTCLHRSPDWSYELGDYWFRVDYWNGFCGVNDTQVVLDEDGIARVVVSHVDPSGWPNWLDTRGHTTGHRVFRWLERQPADRRAGLRRRWTV